ncbi:hypothetical protein Barb7_02808 [Bacteroidales bacterium Barb7]|nr:hypothetical protein Barb7_02808 [Bacteroidales bacterium Barb7]
MIIIPDNILPHCIPCRRAEKKSPEEYVQTLDVSICSGNSPASISCNRFASRKSICGLFVLGQ